MTAQNNTQKHICHECIGDEVLAEEVMEEGILSLCSYCEKTNKILPIREVASRIHEVLQEHFVLSPNEPSGLDYVLMREGIGAPWLRDGEYVADVIANVAGLNEHMASDVRESLSMLHRHEAISEGEEDPYDSEAQYEEREPSDQGFRFTWEVFRKEIQTHSRFFSSDAEEALDGIFGDIDALRTHRGNPVFREIGPNSSSHFVWRARTAQAVDEVKDILKSPASQLGPPPSKMARAGRMNAEGISVFYGAMEMETCVSEIRAPVGSRVVVGKFELLRTVRLLDLSAMARVSVNVSYFDSHYAINKGRAAFLRHLVREISRPIVPQDEVKEYLSTQVVAEYLANKAAPRLDGIIFPSSQTGGNGQNVVLFNHACRVEQHDLPEGTEVRVYMPTDEADDEYSAHYLIEIMETVPSETQQQRPISKTNVRRLGPIWLFEEDEPEENGHYGQPTLRLDLESLEVLDVKSVTYGSERRAVNRHRYAKSVQDVTPPPF